VRIHFYMPENCLPAPEELPYWLEGLPRRIEPPGKASTAQNWILLTYARLARAGWPVELCHTMPENGIVIALTGNLSKSFRPASGTFLTGVVADGIPHPACHFHVLQNPLHAGRLPRSCYLPHWPQPGLISRNPSRGDRFENLAFIGDPRNLAPELRDPAFLARIQKKFGILFRPGSTADWNDYSDADAVLAIRKFGPQPFLRKPATKLYNAWMAGVPFLGGSDSAFFSEGCPGVNYLRCTTSAEMESSLDALHRDAGLRHRLVAAGREAAKRFTPGCILSRWSNLLDARLAVEARTFFAKGPAAKMFHRATQRVLVEIDRVRGLD